MACNVTAAVSSLQSLLYMASKGYNLTQLSESLEPICEGVADHIKREALDDWTSSREEIREMFYDRFLRTVDTPDTGIASHHE